jgi:hypothetical protein
VLTSSRSIFAHLGGRRSRLLTSSLAFRCCLHSVSPPGGAVLRFIHAQHLEEHRVPGSTTSPIITSTTTRFREEHSINFEQDNDNQHSVNGLTGVRRFRHHRFDEEGLHLPVNLQRIATVSLACFCEENISYQTKSLISLLFVVICWRRAFPLSIFVRRRKKS